MSITLDYMYLFVGLGGYIVRWWQVSKPYTFWLAVVVLIVALVWWLGGEGGDSFSFSNADYSYSNIEGDGDKICTKENFYGYDANGELNICIFKKF